MNAILVVLRLTFKEAIRRKIAIASLIMGLAFILVFNLGFHFMTQEIAQNMGARTRVDVVLAQVYNFLHLAAMYATNFMAIVFGVLITADTLSGEITSGTIQVTASKPIPRYHIILGKWLGNALLLLSYIILLAGGSIIGVLIQSGYTAPRVLEGLSLLYLNGILILTITMALSSMMTTLATGGTVFGLFGVAFIGGWIERIGSFLENQTAVNIGIVSSLLMPSEAVWNLASNRMTSSLAQTFGATPFSYSLIPSPLMIYYTFAYILVFLFITLWKFSKRDL